MLAIHLCAAAVLLAPYNDPMGRFVVELPANWHSVPALSDSSGMAFQRIEG